MIIVISLLLVIMGSNISQAYLAQTGDELIKDIEELKVEIEKAQNTNENSSKELADTIYEKWQKIEKGWSIIIIHDELDKIELSLIAMKTCIEEQEYSKSIEEVEKASFLLEHIQDKEKLDFKNIF